jgi:hypothetical protein
MIKRSIVRMASFLVAAAAAAQSYPNRPVIIGTDYVAKQPGDLAAVVEVVQAPVRSAKPYRQNLYRKLR